ncbi:MAG: tetratricopeptide repeat protein, partial [Pseudomonadota bacterium]
RRMTVDREAYTLYLQGRELLHRLGVEGAIQKSVGLLERSLELDPAFAECWMELADAHINVAALTPSLERVKHSGEGARCARRAIELDPNQGHAYSVLGVHEWTSFNPSKALDYSLEAYARDPGSSDVASRLGACLLYLGKAREALPYIEAAVERDPIYIRNFAMLVSAHLANGNFEEARQAGERMADLGGVRMYLALAQFALGEYEAAVESHYYNRILLGTMFMRPPGMPEMDEAARDAYFGFAARGIFSGDEGSRAAYCQMLNGLHATMADPYDSTITMPAIWMGHSELVMKIYSECIHPANMFGLMSLWIDIEPIRQIRLHPDFMAFAEKIGMVEAWNRHGWPDLMPSDPRNR